MKNLLTQSTLTRCEGLMIVLCMFVLCQILSLTQKPLKI